MKHRASAWQLLPADSASLPVAVHRLRYGLEQKDSPAAPRTATLTREAGEDEKARRPRFLETVWASAKDTG